MENSPEQLRQLLLLRVGGFFRNTVHDPELTCPTCRGPSENGQLCQKCAEHRAGFGGLLADSVLILTYVRGWQKGGVIHQSAHTVRAYKNSPPAVKCSQDMALMILAATSIHGDCIEKRCGGPWSSVTFVPSKNRPGPSHPVAELARQVSRNSGNQNRFRLAVGPGFSDPPDRTVRADRFTVSAEYADRVNGQHVLLVDDTWISGAKVQSAAVALHNAGARLVTALCVARWCRDNWPDHKELLDSCSEPYDAFVCPTTGGKCP